MEELAGKIDNELKQHHLVKRFWWENSS